MFETFGEPYFRDKETELCRRLSKQTGLVISTGGGVVTRARNLPLLSQNGRVVFLDIAPDDLPTAGRPLSQKKTPAVLYAERLPLYRAAADEIIPVSRDIAENMTKIMEVLKR